MTGADQTDAAEALSGLIADAGALSHTEAGWIADAIVAAGWLPPAEVARRVDEVVAAWSATADATVREDAMLASDWLRAHDRRVAAEALRSAEDAMGQRLNEFAQGGRHTRARWAQEWLRDRAERVEAGDE